MHLKALVISAAAIAFVSAPALALNPQPEPPNKPQVMQVNPNTVNPNHNTMSTTGHTGAAASDADDNYCGTPVPGHPRPPNCTSTKVNGAVNTNAMHGTMAGGGTQAGAAASDADDNYCGTRTPGHGPHSNWGSAWRGNTAAKCGTTMHGTMQGGTMTH
ncbi:MAG TPA: hypothetical protein VMH86_12395 [Rhizomicrobium sp.]|nr:hypothetical protein [Rhizomicrobium sp.]